METTLICCFKVWLLLLFGFGVCFFLFVFFPLFLTSHGICEDLQFLPVPLSMQHIALGYRNVHIFAFFFMLLHHKNPLLFIITVICFSAQQRSCTNIKE